MNVDRNSLHYRLYSTYGNGDSYNANLCSYVRRLMFGMLTVTLLMLVLTGVAMLILEPIILGTLYLINGVWIYGFFVADDTILIIDAVILFLAIAITTIAFAPILFRKTADAISDKLHDLPPDARTNSLISILRAWRKSFSDKFCPTINVIDEENTNG